MGRGRYTGPTGDGCAVSRSRVSRDSRIACTALGPIEYDLRGEGPLVLHFHGGNVGHNGWFTLSHLVDAGFTLLTPDRPGYLSTPLDEHGSPQGQADLYDVLLDHLGIGRVAVVGVSAGGPGACAFARRYPERTRALILLSAITKQTQLSDDQLNSTLGKAAMSRRMQNPAYFLINQAMLHLPALALQDFVRTETNYDMETGKQMIARILSDPVQREQVHALANAIVPALPRFDGVMNDLRVQQTLPDLALNEIVAPTLIVHSRYDGDVPYDNALHAHAIIPDSELMSVEQFGHLIWLGDPAVTQRIHARVERFLATLCLSG